MHTIPDRPAVRAAVAANLLELMKQHGWTQTELATRSGISQRMISHILARSAACSIETLEAVAAPFGLHGWHLMIPALATASQDPTRLAELLQRLGEAGPSTRELVERLLDLANRG